MRPTGAVAEGDDYVVSWADLDFALVFSRVRETDASIRCLVTPQQLSDRRRVLSPMIVNLFTLADRERLARVLAELVHGEVGILKGSPHLADWKDSVERSFSRVLDLHTMPEPLINLAEYDAPPDAGHLVWPLLARNEVNVFLADQGAGKSYVGLFLAAAVAGNLAPELLPAPFRLCAGGPVIYFDAETNKATQRRRLERVSAALGLTKLPPVHYRTIRPPLSNYGSLVRGYVAEIGAIFAVFDSLTFLAGGDLNTTETSVPTMNVIGEAGENCTKLAIAHHGKAGRESGASPSALGSAAFEFKARSIWLIRKINEEESDHIDQAWTQRKGSDERLHRGFGLRLRFNESNTVARFDSLSAADSSFVATHTGTAQDKIRAALQETDFWKADTNALAKMTGLATQQIGRAVRAMPDVHQLDGGRGRGNVSIFELRKTSNPSSVHINEQMNTPRVMNGVHLPADAVNELNEHPKMNGVHFSDDEPEVLPF